MTGINTINTAVYQRLTADEQLAGMCAVYKGGRRPAGYRNPSLTAAAKRLERGDGAGMWMCDIVVTIAADLAANGMPGHDTLAAISDRARTVLADAELPLDGAKAMPLIEGEQSGPEWDSGHDGEALVELTFGLLYVAF